MFWRMGKGEDAISIFARYYNSLNKTEKINFKTKYKFIVFFIGYNSIELNPPIISLVSISLEKFKVTVRGENIKYK